MGKATARLFAAQGWTVIAAMRNPENETELSHLPNVHLLRLDLSDPGRIAEAAAEAERTAPADVLFNNAGYGFAGALEAASDEQLSRLVDTNFLGTVRVTKAFLPYFRKRKGGTIITTTSSTAYIPYPFIAVYEATKAALETWTAGMSYELSRFNVNIKTVVPGYMQTGFSKNGGFAPHPDYEEDFNRYVTRLTAERATLVDRPEDVAAVVYEAATDGQAQLHYIAGNHATSEYAWLQKDGIEAVANAMRKRFFE